jgi:hypothetical protein
MSVAGTVIAKRRDHLDATDELAFSALFSRRLPVHLSATNLDDVIDWARTLLVGFDDDRGHSWTHVFRHGINKVFIQCCHHGIPKPHRGRRR